MLFNSFPFILLFLPGTLAVFILLVCNEREKLALFWLVMASLFFYGWWNPKYLLLIIASILVNFSLGRLLENRVRPRMSLLIGLVFNLGLLGYCKYGHFLMENVNFFLEEPVRLEGIVLPLAISFFTFQQIAFLVDTYQGRTHEYGFMKYSLFVLFFPQLIAGPIVRHQELIGQFDRLAIKEAVFENIGKGFTLFVIGLIKKVIIAVEMAKISDPIFAQANVSTLPFYDAWAGTLAYTFQIYFDFSGYSDMAIGLALMFGFHIPNNFNSPYRAVSIREFWRRWHMTLSGFLRDYLYIPLGGSRSGISRQSAAVLITMLLGGLWHGASWNFVFWGGLHGVGIWINQLYLHAGLRLPRLAGWFLTFVLVVLGWVLFRAETFSAALRMYQSLLGLEGMGTDHDSLRKVDNIIAAAAIAMAGPAAYDWVHDRLKPNKAAAFVIALLFSAALLETGDQGNNEFIYFQF